MYLLPHQYGDSLTGLIRGVFACQVYNLIHHMVQGFSFVVVLSGYSFANAVHLKKWAHVLFENTHRKRSLAAPDYP